MEKIKIKLTGSVDRKFELIRQVYVDQIIEVDMTVVSGDTLDVNYSACIEAYINDKKTSELSVSKRHYSVIETTARVKFIRFRFTENEGRIDFYTNTPEIPKFESSYKTDTVDSYLELR